MSFLDHFPRPEREQRPEAKHVRSPQFEPPQDELGVAVPESLILVRSDRAVVALFRVAAYSDGVALDFLAVVRHVKPESAHAFFHSQHAWGGDELPDELLRVGVEFSDGRRGSNLSGHRHAVGDDVEGPFLSTHGGGGGSGAGDRVVMRPGYWMWPLPTPGTLKISCEWPAVANPFTTIEIDADRILAAAEHVTKLWRDDE